MYTRRLATSSAKHRNGERRRYLRQLTTFISVEPNGERKLQRLLEEESFSFLSRRDREVSIVHDLCEQQLSNQTAEGHP